MKKISSTDALMMRKIKSSTKNVQHMPTDEAFMIPTLVGG